jgi:hypothetical protein
MLHGEIASKARACCVEASALLTFLDMTVENRDYIFENSLERLQLFQICQNMLKITLGWRRDFYEQQLRKHGTKIRKMIET